MPCGFYQLLEAAMGAGDDTVVLKIHQLHEAAVMEVTPSFELAYHTVYTAEEAVHSCNL
jgi:hypothetical protein